MSERVSGFRHSYSAYGSEAKKETITCIMVFNQKPRLVQM